MCVLRLAEPRSNAFPLKFPGLDDGSISQCIWARSSAGHDALLSVTNSGYLLASPLHSDGVSLSATTRMKLLDPQGDMISKPTRRIALDPTQEFILLELEDEGSQTGNAARILLYEVGDLLVRSAGGRDQGEIQPILVLTSSKVKSFLGFCGAKLVFLDRNLWVHSYEFTNRPSGNRDGIGGVEGALRHFFVPFKFVGGNNGVDGAVTKSGDIVFPKEGELGVVRNALTWSI